jgi:fumarate reductase flavoprotein subunit
MIAVAQPIIQSALARQESRGAHYRQDFPQELPPLLCTEVYLEDSRLKITRRPPVMDELRPDAREEA